MSKNIISICIAIFCNMTAWSGFAASNLPYKEGELIVRFKPKSRDVQRTTAERNEVLAAYNAGHVEHSTKLVEGLSLVKLPSGITAETALSRLRASGAILYAEPNYGIELASINDLWVLRILMNEKSLQYAGNSGTITADFGKEI